MTRARNSTAMRGFIAAMISAISFSTLGIFAELLYSHGFSVLCVLAWRFLVAALFLWLVVYIREWFQSKDIPAEKDATKKIADHEQRRKYIPRVFLLGLVGFSPQAGLFLFTVKILDPGIASLLMYLYPSFVFLILFVWRHQRPKRIQILALALSFLGCILTFWKAGSYPFMGLALGILVAVAYAVYLVIVERVLVGVDSLWATAIIMTAAALVYLCLAILQGTFIIPSSTEQFLIVLCIAIIASVLPIVTLFIAMKNLGARDTSIISTIEPVFTNIFSILLFGENLTIQRILGGVSILAGVLILNRWGYASHKKDSAADLSGPSSPLSNSPGTEEGKL